MSLEPRSSGNYQHKGTLNCTCIGHAFGAKIFDARVFGAEIGVKIIGVKIKES
jgi:hypothetical protein